MNHPVYHITFDSFLLSSPEHPVLHRHIINAINARDLITSLYVPAELFYLDLALWPAFKGLMQLYGAAAGRILIRSEYIELLEDVDKMSA